MATVNPLRVYCPDCNALPGNPCTTPTETSRRPVSWLHLSREGLAAKYDGACDEAVEDGTCIHSDCMTPIGL